MALSPQKPQKLSGGILLIILSLLSIVLMTVWVREGSAGPLHAVRSAVAVVTTPLQHAGAFVAAPFEATTGLVANLSVGQSEIEDLRAQNEELRATVIQLEEYRQENERLQKLLDLSDTYSLESQGARVISRSPDSWNRTLTINKGSADGMAIGMPVMSANGLLGQIESVAPYSSVVRMITDQQSGVAVFLQGSRSEGIVSGSVEGLLYLRYIALDITVIPGDVAITSGAGGVYPKGIIIGEVTSVDYAPSDVYQTIVIRPLVRVATYEEVLVLTGKQASVTIAPAAGSQTDGSQGAATGDAGAADAAGQPASGQQGGGDGQ